VAGLNAARIGGLTTLVAALVLMAYDRYGDPRRIFAPVESVTLNRTCWLCASPIYSVRIDSDGSVTYYGEERVAQNGLHTADVARAAFQAVAVQVDRAQFEGLRPRYYAGWWDACPHFSTGDSPSITVTVVRGGSSNPFSTARNAAVTTCFKASVPWPMRSTKQQALAAGSERVPLGCIEIRKAPSPPTCRSSGLAPRHHAVAPQGRIVRSRSICDHSVP
jgi:hypothetical protein